MKAAVIVSILVGLAGILAGCGDDGAAVRPSSASGVAAQMEQRFPSGTIEDVASFADQLSIVEVLDDRALPFSSPEEAAAGEGYLPRVATLRIVETLWRRAGAPPTPTVTFEMELLGWLAKPDGTRRPFADGVGPWPLVGERLLMAMVVVDGRWSPYSSDTMWPLEGRTTKDIDPGRSDTSGGRSSGYIGERLAGARVDDIATALASAVAYDATLAHPTWPAEDRLERYKADLLKSPDFAPHPSELSPEELQKVDPDGQGPRTAPDPSR
jgi:hypothetical protein